LRTASLRQTTIVFSALLIVFVARVPLDATSTTQFSIIGTVSAVGR
jgi:hypothetical protein